MDELRRQCESIANGKCPAKDTSCNNPAPAPNPAPSPNPAPNPAPATVNFCYQLNTAEDKCDNYKDKNGKQCQYCRYHPDDDKNIGKCMPASGTASFLSKNKDGSCTDATRAPTSKPAPSPNPSPNPAPSPAPGRKETEKCSDLSSKSVDECHKYKDEDGKDCQWCEIMGDDDKASSEAECTTPAGAKQYLKDNKDGLCPGVPNPSPSPGPGPGPAPGPAPGPGPDSSTAKPTAKPNPSPSPPSSKVVNFCYMLNAYEAKCGNYKDKKGNQCQYCRYRPSDGEDVGKCVTAGGAAAFLKQQKEGSCAGATRAPTQKPTAKPNPSPNPSPTAKPNPNPTPATAKPTSSRQTTDFCYKLNGKGADKCTGYKDKKGNDCEYCRFSASDGQEFGKCQTPAGAASFLKKNVDAICTGSTRAPTTQPAPSPNPSPNPAPNPAPSPGRKETDSCGDLSSKSVDVCHAYEDKDGNDCQWCEEGKTKVCTTTAGAKAWLKKNGDGLCPGVPNPSPSPGPGPSPSPGPGSGTPAPTRRSTDFCYRMNGKGTDTCESYEDSKSLPCQYCQVGRALGKCVPPSGAASFLAKNKQGTCSTTTRAPTAAPNSAPGPSPNPSPNPAPNPSPTVKPNPSPNPAPNPSPNPSPTAKPNGPGPAPAPAPNPVPNPVPNPNPTPTPPAPAPTPAQGPGSGLNTINFNFFLDISGCSAEEWNSNKVLYEDVIKLAAVDVMGVATLRQDNVAVSMKASDSGEISGFFKVQGTADGEDNNSLIAKLTEALNDGRFVLFMQKLARESGATGLDNASATAGEGTSAVDDDNLSSGDDGAGSKNANPNSNSAASNEDKTLTVSLSVSLSVLFVCCICCFAAAYKLYKDEEKKYDDDQDIKVDLDYSQTYYTGGTEGGASGENPLHQAPGNTSYNPRLEQARQMEMTAMDGGMGNGTAMAMGAGAGVATAGFLAAGGSDSDGSNRGSKDDSLPSTDSLNNAASTHNPMMEMQGGAAMTTTGAAPAGAVTNGVSAPTPRNSIAGGAAMMGGPTPRNSILVTGGNGESNLDTFGSDDVGLAQLDTSNMDNTPSPATAPMLATSTGAVPMNANGTMGMAGQMPMVAATGADHMPAYSASAIGGSMMAGSVDQGNFAPMMATNSTMKLPAGAAVGMGGGTHQHKPNHRVSAIGGAMMDDGSLDHGHSKPIGPPNKMAMPSVMGMPSIKERANGDPQP